MKYSEALKKLFEIMVERPDIKEVKFYREEDVFVVVSNSGDHVCFGDEFRNK